MNFIFAFIGSEPPLAQCYLYTTNKLAQYTTLKYSSRRSSKIFRKKNTTHDNGVRTRAVQYTLHAVPRSTRHATLTCLLLECSLVAL